MRLNNVLFVYVKEFMNIIIFLNAHLLRLKCSDIIKIISNSHYCMRLIIYCAKPQMLTHCHSRLCIRNSTELYQILRGG